MFGIHFIMHMAKIANTLPIKADTRNGGIHNAARTALIVGKGQISFQRR
jgi:hypothetical protein